MFTLLLIDDRILPARKYGELIEKTLAIPAVEARLLIRKGRGIFLENIEEKAADTILHQLNADGIAAKRIAQDQIPDLPTPLRVSRIQRDDLSFEYRTMGSSDPSSIPWEGIGLVSCGLIARGNYRATHPELKLDGIPGFQKIESETDREIVRENLILKAQQAPARKPAVRRGRDRTVFETIEDSENDRIQVWLDLLTADFGTWLRLSMDNVSYGATKGSVQLGACWAFDAILKQLRKEAPHALTEMTLKLVSGLDITELVFSQIEDFNRYTTWEAYRKALQLEPELPWAKKDIRWPLPEEAEPPTEEDSSKSSPLPEPPSTS
ncbi:MAG: hypothetical protein QF645_04625 [Planctomycetota bacterium]|nr:hypothetical protein [Planctomycetota bacterium]